MTLVRPTLGKQRALLLSLLSEALLFVLHSMGGFGCTQDD